MAVKDVTGRYDGNSFVERHDLWTDAQYAAGFQVQRVLDTHDIELIRVSFADQHGLLRGKTVTREGFASVLQSGCSAPSTLVLKDTSHRTVYPVFHADSVRGYPQLTGVSDLVLVPDPLTFRLLPWAPRTGWVLSDIYFPDGTPVPFSTRDVLRRVVADVSARGYEARVGLEVEFHVFRLEPGEVVPAGMGEPADAPAVSFLNRGYQLLTEDEIDQVDGVVQLLGDNLVSMGLPVRSIEVELGPSQLEVTFAPLPPLEAADTMVLFRSAVKQMCRRHGYHATFMSRPALPSVCSSGWHLHQSLLDAETGENLFQPDPDEPYLLSEVGRGYLGGLLEHAAAASVFSTPTVNGYKRYRPYSLAPDRVVWGMDNRGAMVRLLGGHGDPATRLENRSGEPAANPYLYIASQLVSGLDGVDRALDPGPATNEPYDTGAPRLPQSLAEAMDALRADPLFGERLGHDLVDHILTLKHAEVERYLSSVSDWEQREYFNLY